MPRGRGVRTPVCRARAAALARVPGTRRVPKRRISRVAFGTDNREDLIKYTIAVEVPNHAAHSEHDADAGFQEFNRLADLLQPEDPLVYGGEVLHAV
ncbi:MAG TPA: hypothetical protein VIV12_03635 [Streptosporangiaceae bacterium]